MMYDAIFQKSDTISEKWMPQFLTFLESFVSRIVVTRKGGGVAHVKSGSSGMTIRGMITHLRSHQLAVIFAGEHT